MSGVKYQSPGDGHASIMVLVKHYACDMPCAVCTC